MKLVGLRDHRSPSDPIEAFSIIPVALTASVALQRRNYADDRTESRALDPRGVLGSILTLGGDLDTQLFL